jgi:hypothetical protein
MRQASGFRDVKPKAAPRARRGSMSAAVALVLAGQATVAQAARECEVDAGRLYDRAWSEVKLIVRNRDLWSCAWCGELAGDVHHRVRRGSGGSSDPNVSHSPANLVCLCRRDHDRAHAKDEDMHDRGLWLTTDQDPAEVPVYVRSEWGYERYWLTADGGLSRTSPKGLAA